jgi:acyl carrier protein
MTIQSKLETIIRNLFFGGDTEALIDPDEDFIECGMCDSLGLVRLATAVESEFTGIKIFDQEVNRCTMGSLNLLVDLTRSKLEDA